MRVAIIGDPQSGKSTVAAEVALLIAKARAPKRARPVVPWAATLQPSLVYKHYPIDVRRTRTLAGLLRVLREADAPLVIDDLSEAYGRIVDSYRMQSAEHRERAGLRKRDDSLRPEDWSAINKLYNELIRGAFEERRIGAQDRRPDLVEIYRRGPVMVYDSDFGMVESYGIKARGQSEAGSGSHLILTTDGGLKSQTREGGSRYLRVLGDLSGRVNGKDLSLPALTCKADRQKLARELDSMLGKAVGDLVVLADEEDAEWRFLSEPADDFEGARVSAERSEARDLASQVSALIEMNGLGGRKAEQIQSRADLLMRFFGTGSLDGLAERPAKWLRDNIPAFRAEIESRRISA